MGFFDDPANQPPATGAPTTGATPPNASSYSGVPKNLGDYLGPGGTILDPWTQPIPQSPRFVAPSEADALATPGVQFALNEGNRLQQAGAASKGTLLNARAQQAMNAANIGAALQSYGDIWNRAHTVNNDVYGRTLGEYLLARENFQQNQDRPYSKLNGTSYKPAS